jgi:tetratricopeptide (TPR) repeat protein
MKHLSLIILSFLIIKNAISQTNIGLNDTAYTVVTISPSQSFYLDSRIVSSLSGRSRVTIPINLPEGTVRWYYSFAAMESKNEPLEWISLAGQLTKLYDRTGIASEAINRLVKPTGTVSCDVFVIHPEAVKAFEAKDDKNWNYDKNYSRQNITSGVIEAYPYTPRLQLGLSNASIKTGINVKVEISAVVAKVTPIYNLNNRLKNVNNSANWLLNDRTPVLNDVIERFDGKRSPSVSEVSTCVLNKITTHFLPDEFKNKAKEEKDVIVSRMIQNCYPETNQEVLQIELILLKLDKKRLDSLEKAGKFDDVLILARKIESMGFASVPNRTRLIRALMLTGQYDEAFNMADPMVRLMPDDLGLNLHLAHLYLFKNQTDKAEKLYLKFKNRQNTEGPLSSDFFGKGVVWEQQVSKDFTFFIQNKIFNSQYDNIKRKLKIK